MNFRYLVSGESSITLEIGNQISEKINQKVRMMSIAINKSKIDGIVELITTYRSIKIDYNPCKIHYKALINELDDLQKNISDVLIEGSKIIEIPTLYEGPDLEYVSQYNSISVEQVIKIHSSKAYLIYMLGFTPGFPYLGGMSDKISTPRLKKPRAKIASGSVGIAGSQTGIYPIDSPGGWQLIGKTPLILFDEEKKNPFLLEAGNYIKFKPIDKKTFEVIQKKVNNKTFQVKTYLKDDKNGSN